MTASGQKVLTHRLESLRATVQMVMIGGTTAILIAAAAINLTISAWSRSGGRAQVSASPPAERGW